MPSLKIKPKFSDQEDGAVVGDDIIDKEDFEASSEEEEAVEQKEGEDDDILKNDDYGDEDQKETEVYDEEEILDTTLDNTCLYKFAKKGMSDSDDDDDELVFEDDSLPNDPQQIVKPEDRETKPILTKYERVRILGDRAKQLSLGAKPMLLNVDNINPKDVARLELERKVVPFIIERDMPGGKKERWYSHELKIEN